MSDLEKLAEIVDLKLCHLLTVKQAIKVDKGFEKTRVLGRSCHRYLINSCLDIRDRSNDKGVSVVCDRVFFNSSIRMFILFDAALSVDLNLPGSFCMGEKKAPSIYSALNSDSSVVFVSECERDIADAQIIDLFAVAHDLAVSGCDLYVVIHEIVTRYGYKLSEFLDDYLYWAKYR